MKVSDNERKNIKQGRKIQEILAKVLHRLYKVPVKEIGNDLGDMQKFERKLDIEIQVYDLTVRQIYKSIAEKPVKVYLLKDDNHFNTISKISGFTCANESHHKARDRQCKACKNETQCDKEESQVSCIQCWKYFYGKQCLDNHITNKKCIEHSYVCKKCRRYYKTKDLKPEHHDCNNVM